MYGLAKAFRSKWNSPDVGPAKEFKSKWNSPDLGAD